MTNLCEKWMVWASRQEDAGEEDFMPDAGNPRTATMAVIFAAVMRALVGVRAFAARSGKPTTA